MLARRVLLSQSSRACFSSSAESVPSSVRFFTQANLSVLRRTPLDAVKSARERLQRVASLSQAAADPNADIAKISPTVSSAYDTYDHPFIVEKIKYSVYKELLPHYQELPLIEEINRLVERAESSVPTLEDRIELLAFVVLIKKEGWLQTEKYSASAILQNAYNRALNQVVESEDELVRPSVSERPSAIQLQSMIPKAKALPSNENLIKLTNDMAKKVSEMVADPENEVTNILTLDLVDFLETKLGTGAKPIVPINMA